MTQKLSFDLVPTKSFIRYRFDKTWDAGQLISGPVCMDVWATCLHYGQSCFEGLKAFKMTDGKVRVFRPTLNAERLARSCSAIAMQSPPLDLFIEAVYRVVKDNIEYVPGLETNGSLYIRPFVIGTSPQIGLTPSSTFDFYVLVNPVGDYYEGGLVPSKALIQHGVDRAAPFGTGHVKLAGNYAPVFTPTAIAKSKGYTVTLFLDAKTSTFVEEFATSNFAALTKEVNGSRSYVTPKSRSILPSITNRSLTELAARHFHWKVERRPILYQELKDGHFDEVAACGTAVVITPIGTIHREVFKPFETTHLAKNDIDTLWDDSEEQGEMELDSIEFPSDFSGFKSLYTAYRQIQRGELADTFGWMMPPQGL